MKNHFLILAAVMFGFTVATASAQPGPPPGPNWDGAMVKIFGDLTGFSGTMELQMPLPSGQPMTMLGKIAQLDGKARFEMDMSAMQGGNLPPQAVAQMKQMGMSKMISITIPSQSLVYLVYPDMRAYVSMPTHQTNTPASDYKTDVTKLGEETVNGHDCTKNKMVVTGPDGATHESTVWIATDLEKFPIKVQLTLPDGKSMVMLFKDVKLEKPDATLFDPPAGFTKYDNVMNLMMSRMRGAPPQ
jgi:hypothetical protein